MILMGAPGGASGEAAKILTRAVGSRMGLPYHDSLRSNLFREIFSICILGYNEKSKPKSDPVIPFLDTLYCCPLRRRKVDGWSPAPHLPSPPPLQPPLQPCGLLKPSHMLLPLPGTPWPVSPWLALPLLQAFLDVTCLVMFSSSIW